jgi:hypothetical protein
MATQTTDSAGLRRRRSERRATRLPFHFPERRSGFDRRDPAGWRGRYQADLRSYAESRLAFPLVLAAIIVFNFIDYVMTIRVLGEGGVELNPVMSWLFTMGWQTAALVKLLSAGAVALVLLALRRYRRTLEVSLLVLLGYSLLTFYHVYMALRIRG